MQIFKTLTLLLFLQQHVEISNAIEVQLKVKSNAFSSQMAEFQKANKAKFWLDKADKARGARPMAPSSSQIEEFRRKQTQKAKADAQARELAHLQQLDEEESKQAQFRRKQTQKANVTREARPMAPSSSQIEEFRRKQTQKAKADAQARELAHLQKLDEPECKQAQNPERKAPQNTTSVQETKSNQFENFSIDEDGIDLVEGSFDDGQNTVDETRQNYHTNLKPKLNDIIKQKEPLTLGVVSDIVDCMNFLSKKKNSGNQNLSFDERKNFDEYDGLYHYLMIFGKACAEGKLERPAGDFAGYKSQDPMKNVTNQDGPDCWAHAATKVVHQSFLNWKLRKDDGSEDQFLDLSDLFPFRFVNNDEELHKLLLNLVMSDGTVGGSFEKYVLRVSPILGALLGIFGGQQHANLSLFWMNQGLFAQIHKKETYNPECMPDLVKELDEKHVTFPFFLGLWTKREDNLMDQHALVVVGNKQGSLFQDIHFNKKIESQHDQGGIFSRAFYSVKNAIFDNSNTSSHRYRVLNSWGVGQWDDGLGVGEGGQRFYDLMRQKDDEPGELTFDCLREHENQTCKLVKVFGLIHPDLLDFMANSDAISGQVFSGVLETANVVLVENQLPVTEMMPFIMAYPDAISIEAYSLHFNFYAEQMMDFAIKHPEKISDDALMKVFNHFRFSFDDPKIFLEFIKKHPTRFQMNRSK